MLDDIVFKSRKHHQEITRTPPFHFNSAACLLAPSLARSLAPEPEIKSTQRNSKKFNHNKNKKKKKKKG
jgi:hypothetical protein